MHYGDLKDVKFVQGTYTVDYAAGMVSGLTHDHVLVPDKTRRLGAKGHR